MALSFGEAKTKVSVYLDDVNNGYFTIPNVERYVNDAQFEVQKLLIQAGQNFYVIRACTNLVVGQKQYALPSDFLDINRLEIITQGFGTNTETTQQIGPITLNQQDIYPFAAGTPVGYFLTRSYFWLTPPPDTTYHMRLYYSYRVAPLVNNNQNLDVPEEFAEMVPILATIDGLLRDGRDASVFLEKKRYYEEALKQKAQRRTVDQPRMIVNTSDNGFGALF